MQQAQQRPHRRRIQQVLPGGGIALQALAFQCLKVVVRVGPAAQQNGKVLGAAGAGAPCPIPHREPLVQHFPDAPGDVAGVLLFRAGHQTQLAPAGIGLRLRRQSQRLAGSIGVVHAARSGGHHRAKNAVDGRNDVLCAAEVVVQRQLGRVGRGRRPRRGVPIQGILLLFLLKHRGVCLTEAVNALLQVPHQKQLAAVPRQAAIQRILQTVGILVFIHHHGPVAPGNLSRQRSGAVSIPQQLQGQMLQVCEIQQLVLPAGLPEAAVKLRHRIGQCPHQRGGGLPVFLILLPGGQAAALQILHYLGGVIPGRHHPFFPIKGRARLRVLFLRRFGPCKAHPGLFPAVQCRQRLVPAQGVKQGHHVGQRAPLLGQRRAIGLLHRVKALLLGLSAECLGVGQRFIRLPQLPHGPPRLRPAHLGLLQRSVVLPGGAVGLQLGGVVRQGAQKIIHTADGLRRLLIRPASAEKVRKAAEVLLPVGRLQRVGHGLFPQRKQAALIAGGKIRRNVQRAELLAQQFDAEGVDGADVRPAQHHLLAAHPVQLRAARRGLGQPGVQLFGQPRPKLGRRRVGKGHNQQLLGGHRVVFLAHQAHRPLGQHGGFAAAGRRAQQQRPAPVGDGRLLGRGPAGGCQLSHSTFSFSINKSFFSSGRSRSCSPSTWPHTLR